jgi:hypothetical protein
MKKVKAPPLDENAVAEWETQWKKVPGGLKCHQPDLNSVVGLYRYLLGLDVVALGTGIDMGGGIAKRLSDFIRSGDRSRDHHTGRLIHENRHLLKVEVLITGSGPLAQEIAKQLKPPMIALHKPTWTAPARDPRTFIRPRTRKPRRAGIKTKLTPYNGPIPKG